MNQMSKNLMAVVALACCLINSVFSQTLVNDRYIIVFKADAGVIDPPNPANAGKVPVGEPTSGQSKTALTATLGLNGEIIGILEGINGIIARIDAQEAARWREDARVASVDQSIEGSFEVTPERTDYPVYRDGVLIIPRVDIDAQPGAFLDGVFVFDANSDSWRLQEFKMSELASPGRLISFLEPGDGATIEIIESFPVQVFLTIRGHFNNGCLTIGGIHQRLKDNRFEIVVNAVSTVPTDDGVLLCTQNLVPFEQRVPLQVYGLPRGTYGYSVNGEVEGSFELTEDNTL